MIYSTGVTNKSNNPFYTVGKSIPVVESEFTITAASTANGDQYILAGGLPLESRVKALMAKNATPALTGATDNDVGFFHMVDGVLIEIDADALIDGYSLATAKSTRDLLYDATPALDRTKNIRDVLGLDDDVNYTGGVFLVLTMKNKPTANGVLRIDVELEQSTTN